MKSITPPLKWHGGKGAFNGKLAKWIISLMPPRATKDNPDGFLHYVEPFFGGGAVLLANDPTGISKVVNDLNGELVNFWNVLKDESDFVRFERRAQATPFSEHDYVAALAMHDFPPSESWLRAWGFFVRCRQSLAGRMQGFATVTKTRTRSGMNEQASAWLNAIDGLPAVHARLRRVLILGPRDAKDIIRQQDGKQTLFYCDPPYLHDTRSTTGEYAHEMSNDDHDALLQCLAQIEGRFLLSGYRSEMYDDAAASFKWKRHDFSIANNAASGKTKETKTECVWANY